MSSKGQMTPEILQIFTWQLVSVHITHRKLLKAVRGSYLPFITKHALFPLGTTSLLVSCSGLWGLCVQTFFKHANFFYHIILVAWHYIKEGFTFSWSFFNFLELKCHGTPCSVHVMRPICLKIPSNLLHIELNRTQVHKYDFLNRYG